MKFNFERLNVELKNNIEIILMLLGQLYCGATQIKTLTQMGLNILHFRLLVLLPNKCKSKEIPYSETYSNNPFHEGRQIEIRINSHEYNWHSKQSKKNQNIKKTGKSESRSLAAFVT